MKLDNLVEAELRRVLKQLHPSTDFIVRADQPSQSIKITTTAPHEVRGLRNSLSRIMRAFPKKYGWEILNPSPYQFEIQFDY